MSEVLPDPEGLPSLVDESVCVTLPDTVVLCVTELDIAAEEETDTDPELELLIDADLEGL